MGRVHDRQAVHSQQCGTLSDVARAVGSAMAQLVAEPLERQLVVNGRAAGPDNAEESAHGSSFDIP